VDGGNRERRAPSGGHRRRQRGAKCESGQATPEPRLRLRSWMRETVAVDPRDVNELRFSSSGEVAALVYPNRTIERVELTGLAATSGLDAVNETILATMLKVIPLERHALRITGGARVSLCSKIDVPVGALEAVCSPSHLHVFAECVRAVSTALSRPPCGIAVEVRRAGTRLVLVALTGLASCLAEARGRSRIADLRSRRVIERTWFELGSRSRPRQPMSCHNRGAHRHRRQHSSLNCRGVSACAARRLDRLVRRNDGAFGPFLGNPNDLDEI
jgi:hypothetical protein